MHATGVPSGTNLYSDHPVHFEHRTTGTHGVFLLNSNGMDIKLRTGSLEYNIIGGILDFYFLAGPGPIDVAKEYAAVVGTPAEVPYWGLGLHQCRYGYQNYLEVAEVVANYSAAGIPLETMWTDSAFDRPCSLIPFLTTEAVDYMYQRLVFTNDPEYFPLDRMREIVSALHARNQRYSAFILSCDATLANEI